MAADRSRSIMPRLPTTFDEERRLTDDLGYFPRYLAVPLVRRDLEGPVKTVVDLLKGRLDDGRMQALNASVAFQGRCPVRVFADQQLGWLQTFKLGFEVGA